MGGKKEQVEELPCCCWAAVLAECEQPIGAPISPLSVVLKLVPRHWQAAGQLAATPRYRARWIGLRFARIAVPLACGARQDVSVVAQDLGPYPGSQCLQHARPRPAVTGALIAGLAAALLTLPVAPLWPCPPVVCLGVGWPARSRVEPQEPPPVPS